MNQIDLVTEIVLCTVSDLFLCTIFHCFLVYINFILISFSIKLSQEKYCGVFSMANLVHLSHYGCMHANYFTVHDTSTQELPFLPRAGRGQFLCVPRGFMCLD